MRSLWLQLVWNQVQVAPTKVYLIFLHLPSVLLHYCIVIWLNLVYDLVAYCILCWIIQGDDVLVHLLFPFLLPSISSDNYLTYN